jgi:hypothetical protein
MATRFCAVLRAHLARLVSRWTVYVIIAGAAHAMTDDESALSISMSIERSWIIGAAKEAQVTDVHRFSLSQIDHQELLAILTLRYKTCWLVSKDEVSFPASNNYRLKLKMHHGQITKISSGESLSEHELSELSAQVEADLKDNRIAECGAEILFARRPVTGAFRFTSVLMQILPPPSEAPRPPQMPADYPFVLEYPIQSCRTPEVRHLRRRKNAVEWAWVLNALLHGSIKYSGSRMRKMWAIKSVESNAPSFWAHEFYSVPPGFRVFASVLSEQGNPLPVVPAGSYFGDANAQANVIDTFFLPDNIDSLVGAFLKLDSAGRRRVLRSAAAIYIAGQLWEASGLP